MARRAAWLTLIALLLATALAVDAAGGLRAQRKQQRAQRRSAKAARRAQLKATVKASTNSTSKLSGPLTKVNCGSKFGPLKDSYINGCEYCWLAVGMDPLDATCAVCKKGFRLADEEGAECECARNYQERCENREEPCCRACRGDKYSEGGGADCEDIGKRYTFGVTVKVDRPCDDAEAAAIAANIKSELSSIVPYTCPLSASPGCQASLSVLFASCDDVPAPRDAGSGGVGPWGVFTYRVEYYTDNGSAEGALKSAVRDNTRVTCNSAAATPYFDFFCEHELVGAPDASRATLTKRWAISVPVTAGASGGACPTGERAAAREAEVRGALTAALQLLVGMVELRSLDFLGCNRLARTAEVATGSSSDTVTRPVIEYLYNVVESHDYYAATDLGVSPYATLYDLSMSNPDNDFEGAMDEALPLLSDSLKGKYVPALSYVGPPITCLAGGPRVYPIDPASNSTAAATTVAPLYYLANAGAVTEVGEFFDPRALSPWAVVQRVGGAAVRLVDDPDTDQGAFLEAKGKNGDYSQDRVVAVGVMATSETSGLTCPGFDTQSAASASAKTMMGRLGALSAIEVEAEDQSGEAIDEAGLDPENEFNEFDHFAVVIKVTNKAYGEPVGAADVVDLVFQNGGHQNDTIDVSDLTSIVSPNNGTDIRWFQIRRNVPSAPGAEFALITRRRNRSSLNNPDYDPDSAPPFPTFQEFVAGATYSAGAVNDKGSTLGIKSVALSADSRVIGAGVALLPQQPYMETVDGEPNPLLDAPRRYLVKQLVLRFNNPFPATDEPVPTQYKPAVYTLQFGAVTPIED